MREIMRRAFEKEHIFEKKVLATEPSGPSVALLEKILQWGIWDHMCTGVLRPRSEVPFLFESHL